ncbi:unnamed protein product [Plasmodium vivax]|uniref:(malaria parasite P. vivax) hypothetical protein n=1 Tax=Plasmodium vivax TaxID=5855 RepID=A0A8S4HGW3_PLAVI|nr:unnamed protein product [Plasmodium vivax]
MDSIYTYISKFSEIDSIISKKDEISHGDNYNNCKSFKETKLSTYKDKGEKFLKKCAIIAEHQQEIIDDPKFSKAAYCKYINYWIYDTLETFKESKYSSLLDKFYDTVENLSYCKTYKRDITEQMHKKLKDLYELYDDFNKFKDEPLVDTKETCQYGKKCVENYKKHVKDCKENYKNGLCMNLIYFKNEYDNHRTHVKSCWNDMSYLDPIKTDMSFSIFTVISVLSVISFVLFLLYKVCNNTILIIF